MTKRPKSSKFRNIFWPFISKKILIPSPKESFVGYLLVGLGIAVTLIAGNGLSSMLRTGRVSLTERPPGLLGSMDGIVLAATIYYPLIRLVL